MILYADNFKKGVRFISYLKCKISFDNNVINKNLLFLKKLYILNVVDLV